jgi:hypothetical protein
LRRWDGNAFQHKFINAAEFVDAHRVHRCRHAAMVAQKKPASFDAGFATSVFGRGGGGRLDGVLLRRSLLLLCGGALGRRCERRRFRRELPA